jgi:hypothetical protein
VSRLLPRPRSSTSRCGLRVQARRELVEDRDLRATDEGEGDREALLLSAGQFAIRRVSPAAQAEVGHESLRVCRIPVERGEQAECLAHGHPVRQLALLELDADQGSQPVAIPPGIVAQDADRPGIGDPKAGDRFDGRGLPGAIGSEDAEDLALLDGERQVVHGRAVAIAFAEVFDFDDVHAPSIARGPPGSHRPHVRIVCRGRLKLDPPIG